MEMPVLHAFAIGTLLMLGLAGLLVDLRLRVLEYLEVERLDREG
jgi:hypothetical protein